MKIKHLGLINWANLPNNDYAWEDLNLITGGVGAGKTTLLDALQTIMAGARTDILNYNPGQDEVKQRSRTKESRTLASYILGADDARYSRPNGALGYIIAAFSPHDGESAEPFTAIIGVTAHLDTVGKRRTAKESESVLAIVRNAELSYSDFVVESNGSKQTISLDKLSQQFKLNHPDKTLAISTSKENFLCQLYGALEGKGSLSREQAKKAARSFCKFMAYKKVDDLDDFVRNEVLESHDMRETIESVSSMMQKINGMEKEAQGIQEGIDTLISAKKGVKSLIEFLVDDQLNEYETHTRESLRLHSEYLAVKKKSEEKARDLLESSANSDKLRARQDDLNDQLRALEIKAQNIPAMVEQRRIEGDMERSIRSQTETATALMQQNDARTKNRALADRLRQVLGNPDAWQPEVQDIDWHQCTSNILESDAWDAYPLGKWIHDGDIKEITEKLPEARKIEAGYRTLFDALHEHGDTIQSAAYRFRSEFESINDKTSKLKRDVEQLKNSNRVEYPRDTRIAIEVIKSKLPNAEPRVLCDHVEINDPEWQIAIESYIGGNRFLIMVDEEYEAEAIELLERKGLKSAIIQGHKARKDQRSNLPSNSIFHLARFTHATAEAYFKASYGNVEQVGSYQELRNVRRGVMKSGSGAGSYKMFSRPISEDELVFGKAARERAIAAKQRNIVELESRRDSSEVKMRTATQWSDTLRDFSEVSIHEKIDALSRLSAQQDALQKQLQNLELAEGEDIQEKITAAKQSRSQCQQKLKVEDEKSGSLKTEISSLKSARERLSKQSEDAEDKAEAKAHIVEKYSAYWTDLDPDTKLSEVDDLAKAGAERMYSVNPQARAGIITRHMRQATEHLATFNTLNLRGRQISYEGLIPAIESTTPESIINGFGTITDIYRQTDGAENFLRNDILASQRETLSGMKDRFHKTFISHVCHSMHNAIQEGKNYLNHMNRTLKNHMFGDEYYQFSWDEIPEYTDYARFFKEVTEIGVNNDEGGLFEGDSLSEDSRETFEKIKNLLLDDDLKSSEKDLSRISDYRNYLSYDILKKLPDGQSISLKTYGTGSGGQMETPSYVIRSAALSSALHFGEGLSHLRMVAIDESFSKMDEARCKSVIRYLNESLGLQLIMVMPTKNSGGIHDSVDQLTEVTKLRSGAKRGELDTYVMVSPNKIKRDRVSELWSKTTTGVQNDAHQGDFLKLLEELEQGGARS